MHPEDYQTKEKYLLATHNSIFAADELYEFAKLHPERQMAILAKLRQEIGSFRL